ncbi:hypothetical protein JCM10212_007044 [Sporobolomyces blumeae]
MSFANPGRVALSCHWERKKRGTGCDFFTWLDQWAYGHEHETKVRSGLCSLLNLQERRSNAQYNLVTPQEVIDSLEEAAETKPMTAPTSFGPEVVNPVVKAVLDRIPADTTKLDDLVVYQSILEQATLWFSGQIRKHIRNFEKTGDREALDNLMNQRRSLLHPSTSPLVANVLTSLNPPAHKEETEDFDPWAQVYAMPDLLAHIDPAPKNTAPSETSTTDRESFSSIEVDEEGNDSSKFEGQGCTLGAIKTDSQRISDNGVNGSERDSIGDCNSEPNTETSEDEVEMAVDQH